MPRAPGFHLVLRTDVDKFSSPKRTRKDQADIRRTEYEALFAALRAINVPQDECHVEDRGDGVLLIAPSGIDNELFGNTVLRVLSQRVREHNAATDRPGCRFKLRVAFDFGRVEFQENTVISDSVTTVTRMVDSRRLKSELKKSKADLVAGISSYFYDQVMRHASNAHEFRLRSFKCKDMRGVMWVWPPYDYSPKPTGLIARTSALAFVLLGTWPIGQHDILAAGNSLLGTPPRMADPCSLVDMDTLGQYGTIDMESEFGEFSKCEFSVAAGENKANVKAHLRNPDKNPTSDITPEDEPVIIAKPPGDKDCIHMLRLRDGYRVEINATQVRGKTDLCAISAATARHAVNVLRARQVRRRATKPGGSLIRADACAIIPADRLRQVREINADKSVSEFANWTCAWEQDTTHPVSVRVAFDQSRMYDANSERMIKIGGRDAFVERNVYHSGACQVRIMYRPFTSVTGHPRVEALLITVNGKLTMEHHCEIARRLAGG